MSDKDPSRYEIDFIEVSKEEFFSFIKRTGALSLNDWPGEEGEGIPWDVDAYFVDDEWVASKWYTDVYKIKKDL